MKKFVHIIIYIGNISIILLLIENVELLVSYSCSLSGMLIEVIGLGAVNSRMSGVSATGNFEICFLEDDFFLDKGTSTVTPLVYVEPSADSSCT